MPIFLQQSEKQRTLGDLREELIKAGQELKDIAPDKFDAINVFSKCKELVEWLRKNVEGMLVIFALLNQNYFFGKIIYEFCLLAFVCMKIVYYVYTYIKYKICVPLHVFVSRCIKL